MQNELFGSTGCTKCDLQLAAHVRQHQLEVVGLFVFLKVLLNGILLVNVTDGLILTPNALLPAHTLTT